ncbi:trypsin-like cysteine/serine peptidase domain-containing protein [Chlamydoabsidia padenii]|nr:trypsin-like cysteine/serine peptidase domain-containing protein [Chlamydoabsidia padenii]
MLGNPHVCGGTLLSLNPPQVLTAAHCVLGSPHPSTFINAKQRNPYFVGYGNADRRQQRMMNVVDWVIHPAYDEGDADKPTDRPQEYDVAILTLASALAPSKYVTKAAIGSPDPSDRRLKGTLIGYGYQATNLPESTLLQHITLQVNDYQPLTSKMVNAVATDGTSNQMACHGDSGSPLVAHLTNDQQKTPIVIGTLARIYGVRDSDPTHPTCPTMVHPNTTVTESFVNLLPLLPWISNATNLTIEQLTTPAAVTHTDNDNDTDDWDTPSSRYRHTTFTSSGTIGRLFLFDSYPLTDDDDYRLSTSSLGIGSALLPHLVSSSGADSSPCTLHFCNLYIISLLLFILFI